MWSKAALRFPQMRGDSRGQSRCEGVEHSSVKGGGRMSAIASCSSSQPTAPVPASRASRQSSCAPSSRRGGRELCSFCWCSVSLCAPCPSAAAAARPPCAPPPRCRESCFTSRCFSLSSMRVAEEHAPRLVEAARVGALQSPPSLPDIAPHPQSPSSQPRTTEHAVKATCRAWRRGWKVLDGKLCAVGEPVPVALTSVRSLHLGTSALQTPWRYVAALKL